MPNDSTTTIHDRDISFDQLSLDDAGRLLAISDTLTDEQLAIVVGGMRGGICRIQTSPNGCGMNM